MDKIVQIGRFLTFTTIFDYPYKISKNTFFPFIFKFIFNCYKTRAKLEKFFNDKMKYLIKLSILFHAISLRSSLRLKKKKEIRLEIKFSLWSNALSIFSFYSSRESTIAEWRVIATNSRSFFRRKNAAKDPLFKRKLLVPFSASEKQIFSRKSAWSSCTARFLCEFVIIFRDVAFRRFQRCLTRGKMKILKSVLFLLSLSLSFPRCLTTHSSRNIDISSPERSVAKMDDSVRKLGEIARVLHSGVSGILF